MKLTRKQKIEIGGIEASKILLATFQDNNLNNCISLTFEESGEYYHLYFTRINGLPKPPKKLVQTKT